MLRLEDFFDLNNFEHKKIFDDIEYIWQVLPKIEDYIKKDKKVISPKILGTIMPGAFLEGDEIQIGEGSIIEPGAFIKAPTIIGKNTQVRQGAYIRGNVIVGDNCVVGHTTEIKNSIMLNGAKAGHFAYIGDSILGNNVNLGAGTKLANFEFQNISSKTSKKDEKYIALKIENKPYPTELKKLGAILGDNVETGCNCVTAPGVIMGKECVIYPNVYVPKGYYPPKKLIRLKYRELEIKDIDNS